MSYRGAGDAAEKAIVSKVIGSIPIVGGIMSTLLGFTSVFDDPSVAIARWQAGMQKELYRSSLAINNMPPQQRILLQRLALARAPKGLPLGMSRRPATRRSRRR